MERKLQITGKGKLAISPDTIILSFDVKAKEWEYETTISALNTRVETLRQLIEKEGIERRNLKTKNFSIRKDTTWNKKTEKYDFNGFEASHRLEMELPLSKPIINKLLSQVAKKSDSPDFTISFGVKDPEPHQQQLILQAIAKAKANALLIAEATGVALKEILSIDYSFREIVIRSRDYNYPVFEAETMMMSEPTPDFEPDDIDLTETVTIIWRIE